MLVSRHFCISKRVFLIVGLSFAVCLAPAWARLHSGQDSTPASQHHPATPHKTTRHAATPSNAHASHRASAKTIRTSHRRTATHRKHRPHVLTARERARSRRYQHAFVASSQLRPMAQQLALNPTPAAFAGVSSWAHSHNGEAAAAAYLAVGHAYLLQRKFPDAVAALHSADRSDHTPTEPDGALADYVDYLTAQAYLQSNQLPQAEAVLDRFAGKYPDSIFVDSVPVLRANLMTQEGDPQAALTALNPHRQEPVAGKVDFQLALAKAEALAGNSAEAERLYEHVYLDYPLSIEAGVARGQLATNGALAALPPEKRSRHADALYNAGHYSDAEDEYRSLAGQSNIDDASRNAFLVAAAECDWKLHRLSPSQLSSIPDTSDENWPAIAETKPPSSRLSPRWRRAFPQARGWPKRSTPAATCTSCSKIIRTLLRITVNWRAVFPPATTRPALTGAPAGSTTVSRNIPKLPASSTNRFVSTPEAKKSPRQSTGAAVFTRIRRRSPRTRLSATAPSREFFPTTITRCSPRIA
jgi:outer membrane protein assembly factor BamD (BamD/ComL family)